MSEEPQGQSSEIEVVRLIRDAGVLQAKLIVDGLRDLILVPASLLAAVISLLKTSDGVPGPQFYRLLEFGKDSERWINLFGAARQATPSADSPPPFGGGDMDDIVGRVEAFVVDEYKRGGLTAKAKERLDQIIAAAQHRATKNE